MKFIPQTYIKNINKTNRIDVTMNEIENKYTNNIFENIKHTNEYGNEFWYARELQKVLEYKDWRNFKKVIDKAKESCENSGFNMN